MVRTLGERGSLLKMNGASAGGPSPARCRQSWKPARQGACSAPPLRWPSFSLSHAAASEPWAREGLGLHVWAAKEQGAW